MSEVTWGMFFKSEGLLSKQALVMMVESSRVWPRKMYPADYPMLPMKNLQTAIEGQSL